MQVDELLPYLREHKDELVQSSGTVNIVLSPCAG